MTIKLGNEAIELEVHDDSVFMCSLHELGISCSRCKELKKYVFTIYHDGNALTDDIKKIMKDTNLSFNEKLFCIYLSGSLHKQINPKSFYYDEDEYNDKEDGKAEDEENDLPEIKFNHGAFHLEIALGLRRHEAKRSIDTLKYIIKNNTTVSNVVDEILKSDYHFNEKIYMILRIYHVLAKN